MGLWLAPRQSGPGLELPITQGRGAPIEVESPRPIQLPDPVPQVPDRFGDRQRRQCRDGGWVPSLRRPLEMQSCGLVIRRLGSAQARLLRDGPD